MRRLFALVRGNPKEVSDTWRRYGEDPILEELRQKWIEEDENRTLYDLTAKPPDNGGLSLLPLLRKGGHS